VYEQLREHQVRLRHPRVERYNALQLLSCLLRMLRPLQLHV
jgi:hypothetical protein